MSESKGEQGEKKAMIREAMKRIAKRRQGHSRLKYDRTLRTIVAVDDRGSFKVLNITIEDADMDSISND